MSKARWGRCKPACAGSIVLLMAMPMGHAATPVRHVCQRVRVDGEVSAGQEWTAALGEGWVFRVVPIAGGQNGYSGWDLVLDRDPPAGYPDALLVATLPYHSINEREIGTTFGMRAQDAIGWNPRSFHLLWDPRQFREAQRLFQQGMEDKAEGAAGRGGAERMGRLLDLVKTASTGELRILEARIVPGTSDPQPFAQAWALASSRTPHEVIQVSPGEASARGRLVWMRFALTLWLPQRARLSSGLHPEVVSCAE